MERVTRFKTNSEKGKNIDRNIEPVIEKQRTRNEDPGSSANREHKRLSEARLSGQALTYPVMIDQLEPSRRIRQRLRHVECVGEVTPTNGALVRRDGWRALFREQHNRSKQTAKTIASGDEETQERPRQ